MLFLFLIFFAAVLSAKNLELKNGTILQDAHILNYDDNGALVMTSWNGGYTLRRIHYADFAFSTLRQYKMIPQFLKPMNVTLDSITTWKNGTVGWIKTTQGSHRIFVDNIQIPGMNRWNGIIYPTDKIIRWHHWVLPCFSTDRNDLK